MAQAKRTSFAKTKKKTTGKKLARKGWSGRNSLIFVIIFAAIAGYFIYRSFAASGTALVSTNLVASQSVNATLVKETGGSKRNANVVQLIGGSGNKAYLNNTAIKLGTGVYKVCLFAKVPAGTATGTISVSGATAASSTYSQSASQSTDYSQDIACITNVQVAAATSNLQATVTDTGSTIRFGSIIFTRTGDLPPSAGATCTNPKYTLPLDPNDPQSGVSIGKYYVSTDTWNASGYQMSQTMYVCNYNSWYVIAKANNNSGDGAVKTYPNSHVDFNNPRISSFSTITSTFAEQSPHVGIYEFAYDMWLNGVAGPGSTEVMIWNDNFHQVPGGQNMGTVTFDGHTYTVWKNGSYIAFEANTNFTSGTLNIKNYFDYIIQKGWIPPTSTIGQIDYGFELVSTNNTSARFDLTDFSLTTQ